MNWSSGVLAAQELAGLGVEVVELALEDRDHVPGDVLVDLGVLQRADLALALLVASVVDVELVLVGDPLRQRPLLDRPSAPSRQYYTNPDRL